MRRLMLLSYDSEFDFSANRAGTIYSLLRRMMAHQQQVSSDMILPINDVFVNRDPRCD